MKQPPEAYGTGVGEFGMQLYPLAPNKKHVTPLTVLRHTVTLIEDPLGITYLPAPTADTLLPEIITSVVVYTVFALK
jgi:hypothetical protein